MVFGKLFGAATAALKQNKLVARLGGKDELQAIVAGGILVANASGGVDASERAQIVDGLMTNEAISAGFTARDVSALVEEYADILAAGAFSGKRRLNKELEDVAGNPEVAERVFLVCLDVAAKGGIDDQEKAALEGIARILRQNLGDYL
jgi:tellurite resistance protein